MQTSVQKALRRSMKFAPVDTNIYRGMQNVSADNLQGMAPVASGQILSFRLSGTGLLDELVKRRQEETPGDIKALPGGGLGAPINSPDPLYEYKWLILAGLSGLMLLVAFRTTYRTRTAEIVGVPGVRTLAPKANHRRSKVRRQNRRS